MSSLNIREFATIGLDERIPEASRVVGNSIPVQSVITGRRQQKYLPVNGSTFQPSQNPTFRLSSNSDFIIPSSATLHFKLKNTSSGADKATTCFDDPPATAIWNRAILRASGVLVEDVLELNRSSSALVYSHMSPERYAGQGSIETKNWKWNRDYASGAQAAAVATAGASDPVSKAEADAAFAAYKGLVDGNRLDAIGVAQRQTRAVVEHVENALIEVNLPLSYLFGTFRTNRLFPLSFLGQMTIELTTAQAVQAMVATGDDPGLNYQIEDLYITADMAQLSDDYLKVLAQSFASPEPAMAYNLPIDTLTTITQNKVVSADANSDLNSYVFSKSTPFLKSILFTTQDNAARSAPKEYSCSGMPNFFDNTNAQTRLFIGSEVFPQYGVLESTEEVFRNNMIGLGVQGNVQTQMGLTTHENYKDRSTAGGINYVLFSFAKVNGLGDEYYDLDSYDASLQGAVIDLQMNQVGDETATSCSTLAVVEHTRIMRIGGGKMEVKA